MFDLRGFIKKGIVGMLQNEPEYKVIEYSVSWYDKQVLTSEDLGEINALLEAKAAAAIQEVEEIASDI